MGEATKCGLYINTISAGVYRGSGGGGRWPFTSAEHKSRQMYVERVSALSMAMIRSYKMNGLCTMYVQCRRAVYLGVKSNIPLGFSIFFFLDG